MANILDQPARWRDRAREARYLASCMPDAESKRMMHSIAVSYDKLARRADQRARSASFSGLASIIGAKPNRLRYRS